MPPKQREVIDQRLVRALAHPLRIQILEILCDRVASPNVLSEHLKLGLSHVAYHTRALNKCGCLVLVETAQRRGATEHFYRATRRQFLSDSEWSRMPQSLRPGLSGAMLKSVFDDIEEAVKSGTMDEKEDRHLSRTPLVIDQQGWDEVSKLLSDTLDKVFEIQSEASERLTKSGEKSMLSKVELLHFRSPDPA